jgi:hypothetical protein
LFIVSRWSYDPSKQIATGYTCQYCLHEVTGRDNVIALQAQINERHEQEAARAVSQAERSESSEGTGRKKQKA